MNATPGSIARALLRSLSPSAKVDSPGDATYEVAQEALAYLEPAQREVLVLFYAEGHNYEQIAVEVGCDLIAAQKLGSVAFQQFIRVLRRRHWVRKKCGKWHLHIRATGPGKRKATRNPQWALPKWPANVWDAHRVLGVSPAASFPNKRVAYLRMVRLNHPDLVFSLSAEAKSMAEEIMKIVNRGWELICAEQCRRIL